MKFDFDLEQLKLLAACLALVISTASVEFTIATFVNKVRDEFHEKRTGAWCSLSEYYDLAWGYGLGIAFNFLFYKIAVLIESQTANSAFRGLGQLIWWLYLLNLIAWIIGVVIDGLRLRCWPGTKSEATPKPIEVIFRRVE